MARRCLFVLNGPNLNLLGKREPAIYGHAGLDAVEAACRQAGDAAGFAIEFRQSNHEGVLVDWIHEAMDQASGIVLNAGALTHTSIALLDALKAVGLPAIEVHLSNVFQREGFRHHSYPALAARGVIAGFGIASYVLAIQAMTHLIPAPEA